MLNDIQHSHRLHERHNVKPEFPWLKSHVRRRWCVATLRGANRISFVYKQIHCMATRRHGPPNAKILGVALISSVPANEPVPQSPQWSCGSLTTSSRASTYFSMLSVHSEFVKSSHASASLGFYGAHEPLERCRSSLAIITSMARPSSLNIST